MLIYKIFSAEEWAALDREGETRGSPADLADGYIHFSTGAQAQDTAAKHFAGRDGLLVVAVDAATLGDALKWEQARGGALFPHLHAPLRRSDAIWAKPLPLGPDGAHLFPELP